MLEIPTPEELKRKLYIDQESGPGGQLLALVVEAMNKGLTELSTTKNFNNKAVAWAAKKLQEKGWSLSFKYSGSQYNESYYEVKWWETGFSPYDYYNK